MKQRRIDLAITTYCQSKCIICPRTNPETKEAWDWLTIQHLDLDKIKHRLNNFIYNKPDDTDCQLQLCGEFGDPMMHPNIGEIIDHAFDIGITHIELNTNGGLRNSTWYAKYGSKYKKKLEIVFGIDGIDHDTNWKYREGVNFDKAWENMIAYNNSDGFAVWQFLIFDWNHHQIVEAVDIAKKQNLMLKMRFTSSGVGEHQLGMPQGDTRERVKTLLGELNVMS